ncbi:MAG: phosphatase PAP2 family protein [Saprospiraceae bacterium]
MKRKASPVELAAPGFERFRMRETLWALGLAAAYLLWVAFVVGFRNDHLVFTALCLSLYFANGTSRKVLLALFFFVLYWVIYDSMRIYPNHAFNPVHVQQPYDLEKALFGFQYNGAVVTPNEFFEKNTNPVLDVLSGLFYLCWVPVPLMFAIWLFFKDKRMLLDFSLAFLLTNIFGFMLYYAYPAAPPWYVELHGFQENFSIPGNEAGLANFDRILGVQLFHGMYAKNANVFAAIPSLHAAYPILTLYFGVKKKLWAASWVFLVILGGIWFSAVYSRHHYIIDVLLGAACAVATILVYEKVVLRTRVNGWLERYAEVIR